METLTPEKEDISQRVRLSQEQLIAQINSRNGDFSNKLLDGLHFPDEISLSGANFSNSTIRNCTFIGEHHAGNDDRTGIPVIVIHSRMLAKANFENAEIIETQFPKAIAAGANFKNSILTGVSFRDSQLESSDFSGAKFKKCSLEKSNFTKADLSQATFEDCNFTESIFCETRLNGANLTAANLHGNNLTNARLEYSILDRADLSDANLSGAILFKASLKNSNLQGASANELTSLEGATMPGCIVDRYFLDTISNVHRSQRAEAVVKDGLGELRLSYGGFWQFIHLVVLFLFLIPYMLFIAKVFLFGRIFCSPAHVANCVTLKTALWSYITTGGQIGKEFSFAATSIFFYSLFYNLIRASLLWKTKSLELSSAIRGISPQFTLRGFWRVMISLSKILLVINLILILYNTYLFLQTPVMLSQ